MCAMHRRGIVAAAAGRWYQSLNAYLRFSHRTLPPMHGPVLLVLHPMHHEHQLHWHCTAPVPGASGGSCSKLGQACTDQVTPCHACTHQTHTHSISFYTCHGQRLATVTLRKLFVCWAASGTHARGDEAPKHTGRLQMHQGSGWKERPT